MKNSHIIFFSMILLIGLSCNLPINGGAASADEIAPVPAGGIQITTPTNSGQFSPDTPMIINYLAGGGPFLEIALLVDDKPILTAPVNSQDVSISGSIEWSKPYEGGHRLTLQAVTVEGNVYSAFVDVTINASASDLNPVPTITPTPDPDLAVARQRVSQILKDNYDLNMTAPPVGRKSRSGVTTDPWTSAVYYGDWFISVSLYTDGSEVVTAYPVNHADPNANPNFINPNDKSANLHVCRPSGTIKLLAVFVDYQNLGVTQAEALDALTQAVDQINGKYAEASRAVGAQTPILQIQVTGAYLASPTLNQYHLLTPEIVRQATGYDVSQFDILTQIDLDANNTYATAANFESFGFAWGGCGNLPLDVHMWIGLTAKDQLYEGSDSRLRSTLGHELLHDMGYPISKTGVHEWICGDGSVPDPYDQCNQDYLPTLMMGWTDTDGDGVVEILDTTPYGFSPP